MDRTADGRGTSMDQVIQDLAALMPKGDTAPESGSSRMVQGIAAEEEQQLLRLYHITRHASDARLGFADEELAMTTLGWYAFRRPPDASQAALRSLHNILHLLPSMRQRFVDHQCPDEAARLIKDGDGEIATIAILMLCRLEGTSFDYDSCFEDGDLLDSIHQSIAREADATTWPHGPRASALNARLMLLSIIAARCRRKTLPNPFIKCRHSLLQLLDKTPVLSPPLPPQLPLLMHAVAAVLPENTTSANPGPRLSVACADRMAEMLSCAIRIHGDDEDFEAIILPPVELFLSLATSCELDMRKHLKFLLLPSPQDRSVVLGRGHTLPHQLISTSVGASRPEVKRLLAALLFELSESDAQQLVSNVGFGCASGLLHILGRDLPGSPATCREHHRDINVVTGQWRDAEVDSESGPNTDDWTEDERLREAERLFVLFERLRATGVGVENPVRQAVQEGRLVPSDA